MGVYVCMYLKFSSILSQVLHIFFNKGKKSEQCFQIYLNKNVRGGCGLHP